MGQGGSKWEILSVLIRGVLRKLSRPRLHNHPHRLEGHDIVWEREREIERERESERNL